MTDLPTRAAPAPGRARPAAQRRSPLLALRHVGYALLALAVVTLVGYWLTHHTTINPSVPQTGTNVLDPVTQFQGPEADAGFPSDYGTYLGKLVQGDAGVSMVTGQPVREAMVRAVPPTIELGLAAALLSYWATTFVGRRLSGAAGPMRALVGLGAPALAVVAILIAANREPKTAFPTDGISGQEGPPRRTGFPFLDSLLAGDLGTAGSVLIHLVVPAVIVALLVGGLGTWLIRRAIDAQSLQPYVVAARAKGLPESVVLRDYAGRAAASGIRRSGLLAAAVAFILAAAVEHAFGRDGLGAYGFQAFDHSDVTAMSGVIVALGAGCVVALLIANLILDLRRQPQ